MGTNENSVTDETGAAPTRTLVLQPVIRGNSNANGGRSADTLLDETAGLAHAIALDVVSMRAVPLNRPRPSTLFGGGVVEEVHDRIEADEIGLVIVGGALTPVQQRNLERAWSCKVIDRTGLILEIFGARARTREGQLQVELAALSYQRSRLVRSWTHLERQRGGFGFVGGPGESQIEIDRRLIDDRITRLKRELEQVRRTRGLHRRARARVPYPLIALAGYTNAGKSTLFNRITNAEVYAEDMLFATLDPTMRQIELPSGRTAILSDTVGFISDLPTDLVAAFRATLEEVTAADVIVHVRDTADPDTDAQQKDVEAILENLLDGVDRQDDDGEPKGPPAQMEILNKIDLIDADERAFLADRARHSDDVVMLSAVTGEGCDEFLARIDAILATKESVETFDVSFADGAALAWLYERGEVIERDDSGASARITVRLAPRDIARFRRRLGQEVVTE
ncbi:MAG: GTPase HflX [Rhodospirillaceae bacterium]|nr:GTPase HflX [Rhodospirillaceae bacterium]MBT3932492.1 GTPase HflX [Rhodospirillaceae bacterium]MBT4771365.1 GTPase HflX [Rhodospirillaceae bacterium]MBT5359125.1 GTPase HflX [Rhodospirillaceae bacterium]MBT5768995.1 GTPase HflX [Rhodospirillaceae bacterium]